MLVVSDGGMGRLLDIEPLQEPVVRVPWSIDPRLDPRTLLGACEQMTAALVWQRSEDRTGLAGHHETDRDGTAVGFEDVQVCRAQAAELQDLSADVLARGIRGVRGTKAADGVADQGAFPGRSLGQLLEFPLACDVTLDGHVAGDSPSGVPDR